MDNVKEFSLVLPWCTFTEEASLLDGLTSSLGTVGPLHDDDEENDDNTYKDVKERLSPQTRMNFWESFKEGRGSFCLSSNYIANLPLPDKH